MTRHLGVELKSDDWTLMVLHYLGLDHIGHLIGPKSSLVPPKLREMDGIVMNIMETLKKQVSCCFALYRIKVCSMFVRN